MDSLTQIVLGAATGELIAGRKIGNKAQFIGAIAGTLPDMDVLATSFVQDDLYYLQIHRGYSHSAFVHLLVSFPLAYLTYRIFKRQISYSTWYFFWLACLITHTLLDCYTTFGTQLLLPFSNTLVGFNNISVIDPLYTLPFMILLMICLFINREKKSRRQYALAAVFYSLFYMAYTFAVKYSVHQTFHSSLKEKNIQYESLSTTPTILNSFLWSAIASTSDSVFVGEYSILQDEPGINWHRYPVQRDLLNHPAKKELDVLTWFSQGKYILKSSGDTLHFFNIKWGRADFRYNDPEKAFLFYFKLYPVAGAWHAEAIEPEFRGGFSEAFELLWYRIFHKNLPPSLGARP